MNIKSRCGQILSICLLFVVVVSLPCWGQPSEPAPANGQPDPFPAEDLTVEMVEARIKEVAESTVLDEATKKQVSEDLAKAKASLESANRERQEAAKFTSWIESAEADRAKATSDKQKPPTTYDFSNVENEPLAELTKDLAELEDQRVVAKQDLEAAKNEPQRRTQRLQTISADVAAARKTVEESEQQLKTLEQTDLPPATLTARKMQLAAQRQAALAVIEAREAERRAYEAQGELPRLLVDVAAERLKQLEADIAKLNEKIADRRQYDAGEQLNDAEQALADAPKPLKPLWRKNVVDRGERWIELADQLSQATQDRDRLEAQFEKWRQDYEKTVKRADNAASGTIGQLLIRKKSALPDLAPLRKEFEMRELEIRQVQAEIYDLEDRRSELIDAEGKAGTMLAQLEQKFDDLPDDAEQRLVDVYRAETLMLDNLINDMNRYFNLLIGANEHLEDLIAVIEDFSEFINQRIFWIRSTAAPGLADLPNSAEAIRWLLEPASWRAGSETAVTNLVRDPVRSFLGALFVGVWIYFRRRALRGMKRLAAVAEPRSCRTFAPTLKTLGWTVVAAAGWPLLILFVGWAIRGSANGLVRAASETLAVAAWFVLAIELGVQVCRAKGLAVSHFHWPAAGVATLKSNLRLLLFFGLPLVLVFVALSLQNDQKLHASLGRFCYVAFMLLVAFVSYRLFRATGGVLESVLSADPGSWLKRLQRFWRACLILVPLSLAVLSIVGFYYTSQRLAEYLLRTAALVFSLVVLGAMLYRWVRIKRRRLRWQQAMEHRERQAAAEDSEAGKTAEIVVEDEEVDLMAIDQQTRRLIRSFLFFAGLIGMWFIWSNVFPMLTLLEQWDIKDVVGGSFSITVRDVLMAALVAAITVASARNFPGLVDILLLEKLQIESSIRYAISTLSQYLIAFIGIVVAAGLLGFSWGKVQWLVAAMGVGLGFGLQEIVANFVCGIILLFERPIRVGDVVTLTDTTGVVTKISIRATRIRNWDRQELVIPNKELITGRIVNWTLTDKLNRFVVTVGVAYGSDTRRARELIFEILRDHPHVLEDPVPLVTFEQFGDSTLNIVIRAYLSGLDERLETIHEVHTLIHERFNAEGIEIAFPQRDLHIRSIEQAVEVLQTGERRETGKEG